MNKTLTFLLLLLTTPAVAKLNVVATLPDYGALVQMIGGEHVEVQVLASPAEDPHYVDAKPSFIIALHRADLLVSNGLELEIGWLPSLVVQSRNPSIQRGEPGRIEIGTKVGRLLEVATGGVDRSMGDVHGQGNPHVYHDPRRMRGVLPIIAARLAALDPAHSTAYQKNLARQDLAFETLINELRRDFGALPAKQRRVITYHRSLSYLLETLGLESVATLEPKPGVAPSPAHVASVLAKMKREGVSAIVHETYYPARTGQTLAKLGGGRLVLIAGGTAAQEDYLAHVRRNAAAFMGALGGMGP